MRLISSLFLRTMQRNNCPEAAVRFRKRVKLEHGQQTKNSDATRGRESEEEREQSTWYRVIEETIRTM